jgi:hypothetical protein
MSLSLIAVSRAHFPELHAMAHPEVFGTDRLTIHQISRVRGKQRKPHENRLNKEKDLSL